MHGAMPKATGVKSLRRSPRRGVPPRERSQLPASATLIALELKTPPVPHWLQDLGTRWDAEVKLHVCRPSADGSSTLLQLLEVTAPAGSMPSIIRFLHERAGPRHVSVSTLAPHRLLVRLAQRLPPLCRCAFEMGAICTTCPFLPTHHASSDPSVEEEFSWSLLVRDGSRVPSLLKSLERPGAALPHLVRVGRYRAMEALTPRQELAVSLAVRLGYYDVPRRADLDDVARALGTSRTAAMEVLRRATRKLAVQRQLTFPPTMSRLPSETMRPLG